MSKYIEAEEHLICFLTECSMWCRENHLTETFNRAIEALQIADRLEQAIIDEQTADCIIVDTECVNNKQDKEVWLNGYSQALTNIRGIERSCDNCKWQGTDCWKVPVGRKCNDCNQWCERGDNK